MQIFDVSFFPGIKGVHFLQSSSGEEEGISLRFLAKGASVYNERQAISMLGDDVAGAGLTWATPQPDYWLIDLDLLTETIGSLADLPWLKGKVRIRPELTLQGRVDPYTTHPNGFISITIRPDNVFHKNDLLEQALTLLDTNNLVAATVMAGGALETHLRDLCRKFGLDVKKGEGSISKYDGVVAQARNQGTVIVYSATDSKSVTLWGGMRNDAAHDPGAFKNSKEEVRRMIEGIQEFIKRTL